MRVYVCLQTFLQISRYWFGSSVFICSYSFDSVRFTTPDVWCAAMEKMAGRTARAKCRQDMILVCVWVCVCVCVRVTRYTFGVLQLHKLLYLGCGRKEFSCGRKEFSCGRCIQKSYSYTFTTHMAPRWIIRPGTGRMFKVLWDRSEALCLSFGQRSRICIRIHIYAHVYIHIYTHIFMYICIHMNTLITNSTGVGQL